MAQCVTDFHEKVDPLSTKWQQVAHSALDMWINHVNQHRERLMQYNESHGKVFPLSSLSPVCQVPTIAFALAEHCTGIQAPEPLWWNENQISSGNKTQALPRVPDGIPITVDVVTLHIVYDLGVSTRIIESLWIEYLKTLKLHSSQQVQKKKVADFQMEGSKSIVSLAFILFYF